MRNYGFEPGWGDTVGRIKDTMRVLHDLFLSPDSQILEKFMARIPMVSKIVIISPHGWFGQENVLGRPDTGGQVVYILDQVRYLERTLAERIRSYGFNHHAKNPDCHPANSGQSWNDLPFAPGKNSSHRKQLYFARAVYG
ncbi:MAG: hypothetical protein R3C26_22150 [Calditrichia bacterium]